METYVKVGGKRYRASIVGRLEDPDFAGRSTKTITFKAPITDALSLFKNDTAWSIVVEDMIAKPKTDEEGRVIYSPAGDVVLELNPTETEYDNSVYSVAGNVTDHRNGTVSVKMGKPTAEETQAGRASEAEAVTRTVAGRALTKAEAVEMRLVIEAAAAYLPDEEAVAVPSLSKAWAVGEAVTPGMRRYYDPTGRLYKCVQGHTTQADWTPDKTPALWAVVDAAHAGTQDDPIPAARGMEYEYGKYYSDPEDGKVYLCTRQGTSPGETVTLQYLPHELIGHYFAAV